MKDIKYCDSEHLLAWALHELGVPSEDRFEDFNPIDLDLSFYYGKYGLPDGLRSLSDPIVRPSREEILHALHKTVSPMIPRNKAELRDIPLGFAKLPTVDAYVYINSVGARAIILNAGLFAGLYSANERYLQLFKEAEKKAEDDTKDLESLILQFAERIAIHLLGKEKPDDEFFFTVSWEWQNPRIFPWIWTTTRVQQLFLLLHEYGHVVTSSGKREKVRHGVFRHCFVGPSEEFKADRWAAICIAEGAEELTEGHPIEVVRGVFLLFEYLELLHKIGMYPRDKYPAPRKRFAKIEKILNPHKGIITKEDFKRNRWRLDKLAHISQMKDAHAKE